MQKTMDKLKVAYQEFKDLLKEADKNFEESVKGNGNKAAGKRFRKSILEISKEAKELKKLSIESEK